MPCLNHLLNTAFIHTLSSSAEFQEVISNVTSLCCEIRNIDAILIIGKKCPLAPKTRWIYIHDSLQFIQENSESISTYLRFKFKRYNPMPSEQTELEEWNRQGEIYSTIPQVYKDMFIILLPIKLASLAFEYEQSRLPDVIPTIYMIFKCYRLI